MILARIALEKEGVSGLFVNRFSMSVKSDWEESFYTNPNGEIIVAV